MKKDDNKYRVLLFCHYCDKVYNGTKFMPYSEALKWHYNTILKCKDICKYCNRRLVSNIQKYTNKNDL